jgi:hypothetical protein
VIVRASATLCLLTVLVITTSCQPQIFARSDSPDGKYRCEVIQVRPALSGILGREDWRYDFSLRDIKTGERLPGKSFEFGDGTIVLNAKSLEFKWTENQLAVFDRTNSPAQQILVASFNATGQHWKQTN